MTMTMMMMMIKVKIMLNNQVMVMNKMMLLFRCPSIKDFSKEEITNEEP
jgi:hypothetical protein